MPELVIKGGRVIDADGERARRRASSTTAASSTVGADLDAPAPRARRRRLRRQPRPRRPPHPPARAGQGGGRDDRDRHPRRGARRLHRRRRHAQHRRRPSTAPPSSARCSSSAARRSCDVHAVGRHHRRPRRASSSRPMAEMAALGVRIFTDDGTGVQDDRLMRRALEYAGGPRRHPRPALRGSSRSAAGGHMHEGEWSSRLGLPGIPAEAEELMVHPRHRAGPAHRRPGPLPAPVDRRLGRAGPGGQGRRACRSPPRPPRTTSRSPTPRCAGYDPVFKVNPPLRTDADVAAVRAGLADGTIDAIATDHAPHTQEAKEAPVRPGAARACSASRPRWPSPSPSSTCPIERVLALLSWQPGRHRRARRRRTAARSPPGRPANLCVIDPDATWTVDPAASPAAAATPPTPAARSPAGSATPSCSANPS